MAVKLAEAHIAIKVTGQREADRDIDRIVSRAKRRLSQPIDVKTRVAQTGGDARALNKSLGGSGILPNRVPSIERAVQNSYSRFAESVAESINRASRSSVRKLSAAQAIDFRSFNTASALAQSGALSEARRADRERRLSLQQAQNGAKGFHRSFGGFAPFGLSGGALGAAGAGALIIDSIRLHAQYERLENQLGIIIGDTEKAKDVTNELLQIGANSPLPTQDYVQAARTLLAVGESADTVVDTVTRLGKISFVTPAGLSDLAFVLAQSRAEGKLLTRDLRQFETLGIPIRQILADVAKVDVSRIESLTEQGRIRTPLVDEAFRRITDPGGQFADSLAKGAKDLAGSFTRAYEQSKLFRAEVGETATKALSIKEALDFVADGFGVATEKLGDFNSKFDRTTQGGRQRLKVVQDIIKGVAFIPGPFGSSGIRTPPDKQLDPFTDAEEFNKKFGTEFSDEASRIASASNSAKDAVQGFSDAIKTLNGNTNVDFTGFVSRLGEIEKAFEDAGGQRTREEIGSELLGISKGEVADFFTQSERERKKLQQQFKSPEDTTRDRVNTAATLLNISPEEAASGLFRDIEDKIRDAQATVRRINTTGKNDPADFDQVEAFVRGGVPVKLAEQLVSAKAQEQKSLESLQVAEDVRKAIETPANRMADLVADIVKSVADGTLDKADAETFLTNEATAIQSSLRRQSSGGTIGTDQLSSQIQDAVNQRRDEQDLLLQQRQAEALSTLKSAATGAGLNVKITHPIEATAAP